jgi:hypothetical protein
MDHGRRAPPAAAVLASRGNAVSRDEPATALLVEMIQKVVEHR